MVCFTFIINFFNLLKGNAYVTYFVMIYDVTSQWRCSEGNYNTITIQKYQNDDLKVKIRKYKCLKYK